MAKKKRNKKMDPNKILHKDKLNYQVYTPVKPNVELLRKGHRHDAVSIKVS